MSDPYREAAPQTFCDVCRAQTARVCSRCARPGCADHLFGDPLLCTGCELVISSRRLHGTNRDVAMGAVGALGALGGSVVLMGVAALFAGPIGAAIGAGVFYLGLGGAVGFGEYRRRTERRRFVAEKRQLPR